MRKWITAVLAGHALGAPSPAGLKSDISILVDNDLQGPESPTADAAILVLGAEMTALEGEAACEDLGEQLWALELGTGSIQRSLDFLRYQEKGEMGFWIAPSDDALRGISTSGDILDDLDESDKLPVLCTQTAPFSNSTTQDTSEAWRVSVRANNEDLTGYRDRNSFRFMGVRYAPQPERFTHAHLHTGQGDNVSTLNLGPQCMQAGEGSEDCHFLNIWTPHLPHPRKACSPRKPLKPVMLWIHGGGFTGGTANDPVFDGGNLASRGEVVVVATNYRVGTLGFLALDDETSGNYGFSDAVLSLDWVREHIRSFGGDPERVTVFGQSAGAAVVRAMLASPEAKGKFAGAIPLSNLGGLAYGESFSKYRSISEAADAGAEVLEAANCTDVTCLRGVPAETLSLIPGDAHYLVVDGTYLTSDGLQFSGEALDVHLMMGIAAEDGTPMVTYPPNATLTETDWITDQGLPVPSRDLFPLPDVHNETLAADTVAARLATDAMFRCADQATTNALLSTSMLPEVYYYEFDRTYQIPGWPKLDLCEPGGRPAGDPAEGYLRCHSGELLYVFGNVAREGLPMRDGSDLAFERLVLDVFASFARTFDPNPERGFFTARGYESTALALEEMGRWEVAVSSELGLLALGPGGGMEGFRDVEQCEWLGLGLEYYL